MKRAAVVDHPIWIGSAQLCVRHCSAKRKDASARGFTRSNPRRRIFDNDALPGRKADERSPFQEWFGMRFALYNIVAGDEELRNRQPGRAQSHFSQPFCGRSHQGPKRGG